MPQISTREFSTKRITSVVASSARRSDSPSFGSADPPPLADPNDDAQLPRGRGPGGPRVLPADTRGRPFQTGRFRGLGLKRIYDLDRSFERSRNAKNTERTFEPLAGDVDASLHPGMDGAEVVDGFSRTDVVQGHGLRARKPIPEQERVAVIAKTVAEP